jgi:glutathione synthase
MAIRLGVIMDPIKSIHFHKDSTLGMLLAARARGWTLYYMEQGDLFLRDGRCLAEMAPLDVMNDEQVWYHCGGKEVRPLDELNVVLMRKDPPFDMEFLYTLHLLEHVQAMGTAVVNAPSALRDMNEKLFAAWFTDCCPPTLVSRNMTQLAAFVREHGDTILKPLDGMGGTSVFRVTQGDPNTSVILETMTRNNRQTIMAQRYLPEIVEGDKRIILVDGEPVPYALARIPAPGETRGNLAAGGTGKVVELSERDRWICNRVGPVLRKRGVLFAGLDVIGDYLTEINVTSPTCLREIDKDRGSDIGGQLMDAIQTRLERS